MTLPARKLPSRFALALLLLAVLPAATGMILGMLGAAHPAFDSIGHFRAHLAALLAFAAIAVFTAGLRREGLVAGVLALGGMATLQPFLAPFAAKQAVAEALGPQYRLLQFNGRFDNAKPQAFISLAAALRPDVITLEEASPLWLKALEPVTGAWPHQFNCPSASRLGGVLILSRRPFWPDGKKQCSDDGALGIADFDFAGQKLTIAAVHLDWPWPHGGPAQIGALTADFAALGKSAILAGDFNAAPWSASLLGIANSAGMNIAKGLGPSWIPAALPAFWARYAGLPLDNVLTGPAITIRAARVLDAAGSDHLPIRIDFSFSAGATEAPQQVQRPMSDFSSMAERRTEPDLPPRT